jgi:glycosyltransferase involved in cell wall biosynthesis
MRILVFAESTIGAERRSGIHRVVVEAAQAFPASASVDFVKWDEWEGQLRYLDATDLKRLFKSDVLPEGVAPHRCAHRVWYRFGDTLDAPADTWLWFPEIAYHRASGNDVFARIVSQCREYGVRTAAVFYDLIPVSNAHYQEYRPPHLEYSAELIRADLILPISSYCGEVLKAHYAEALGGGDPFEALDRKIVAVPLPEVNSETPAHAPAQGDADRNVLLMVGTVEPRKQQVQVLEAFNHLCQRNAAVAAMQVHVYGSLHGHVADAFNRLVSENPRIKYFDYASTAMIEESYRRALFTVFASNDEGFGLPIVESLARGVPVLTASFGSMAEAAEGGGCFRVDVNSPAALSHGIARMAGDAKLRARLRAELAQRSLRRWSDYADDTVAAMRARDDAARARETALEQEIRALLANKGDGAAGAVRLQRFSESEAELTIRTPRDDWASAGGEGFKQTTAFISTAASRGVDLLDAQVLRRALAADYCGTASQEAYRSLLKSATRSGANLLLTARRVEAPGAALHADMARLIAAGEARDAARFEYAVTERAYAALLREWMDQIPARQPTLGVIISTYNRGPFVEENVRWLLHVIDSGNLDANVTVVDNLSTDDTRARLVRFVGHPKFEFRMNSANVGMLGNLRVCSSLLRARHCWVTGDDDFIVASELAAIIDVLKANPGLPLAVVNFGVYHREALHAGDNAGNLIQEQQKLAPDARASGMTTLREAASQHDNLFTAVYPLVFRADILAACFNYPFTGVPFGDLVECVPTSKILFETYRDLEVYWHRPVGIVGNAHNSWSRHRPRWHAVIMPQLLDLAREAGLAPDLLDRWAQVHQDLFYESIEIAKAKNETIHIDEAVDLEPWRRIFRKPIEIPPDMLRAAPPSPARRVETGLIAAD